MATVNKDFKIKNGLVVEGTTGTINGNDILTKSSADQEYIQDIVGGSGDSNATANTLVLRDGNASFAANVITADIVGDVTGQVSDISNFDTDDLAEGNNQYFTDTRAKDAVSAALGDGIEYVGGSFDVQLGTGLQIDGNNSIEINRSTVDGWYDASGSAANAYANATSYADGLASNYDPAGSAANAYANATSYADGLAGNYEVANAVSDHNNLTTGVHGVSGDVVGTSDTQDLSNKRFIDTVYFTDGVTINNEGEIAIRSGSHDFDVQANYGDLHLKTTASGSDVQITAQDGDILLNTANGTAYYGSASAENEIATHSYVDNAVSGLSWKQAVNLLAHTSYSLTGDASTTSVDGHSLSTADGYRILLTAQSTDSENGIYDISVSAGAYTFTRSADADTYQELIGAAVYVMEGSQYGSTSWVQGDHYLTDFTSQEWTQFSGQGSVTAGTGITVDGLEVSVDRTTVDDWYDASGSAANAYANATSYADGLASNYDASGSAANAYANATAYADGLASNYDAAGSAANAYANATAYADGLASNYDASGSAANAYANATSYTDTEIDALTTDDIEEGVTNLYFANSLAKDAAADLLTNATLTNITITGTGSGLTITAENGVADSDTDDLTEGANNLYFTDQRALDAVSGSDITPNSVTIDTYRKEEATQQYVATASTVNVHTLPAGFESAKYLVRVVGSVSGTKHSQLTEILLTIDGNNNIAITEYGTICTDTSNLASFSATYVGGEYKLTATTAVNGCEVIAAATMLSWAD